MNLFELDNEKRLRNIEKTMIELEKKVNYWDKTFDLVVNMIYNERKRR